jgi:AP-5 complex subunit mu-1
VFHIDDFIELVLFPGKNFYLGVVPLIESNPPPNTPFIEVSASFSFLSFLETSSRSFLKTFSPEWPPSASAPLRHLITQILPFGFPVIHDAYFVSQLTTSGDLRRFSAGYQAVAPLPVPSWKTFLLFARPQVELKLREVVLGSIDGVSDTFDVFGEVRCISSLNYLPTVTLPIPGIAKVENLTCHYAVKKIDEEKVLFSPPTGISQLLQWRSPVDRSKPPVTGRYAIKEDDSGLHFSLTISVHPPVKSVTAQLPFPGRGPVSKHQFQSPGGQLKMSKKEATIMWMSKPGENGTLTLTGVLNFEGVLAPGSEKCRAYVNIKSKKKSMTGLAIVKDSVTFDPPQSATVVVDTSYAAEPKRYIFWETPLE